MVPQNKYPPPTLGVEIDPLWDEESQPTFTVALGCPGKDLVRLWPLPVTSPWFEDWWEFHQPGLITGLPAADRFLARLPRQVLESPH